MYLTIKHFRQSPHFSTILCKKLTKFGVYMYEGQQLAFKIYNFYVFLIRRVKKQVV